MGGQKCFFDVSIDSGAPRRITFQLYSDVVPKTCENFKCLCTGEKGNDPVSKKPLHYKNSIFHRVIPEFMLQGGDFTNNNGTGGVSIYGAKFADENFNIKHEKKYLLSMANCGPNTNGSQFFITTARCPWLDGKHVVFGEAVGGSEVIDAVESLGSQSGATKAKIKIVDCGTC